MASHPSNSFHLQYGHLHLPMYFPILFQGFAKTPGTGQQEAHWAGALIPAFESDEQETGAMTVVVVRLIDDR